MTCGEELIMFNERVLEIKGGASIPCRKGAQPENELESTNGNVCDLYGTVTARSL
jgi:hypothetical protein